MTPSPAQPRGLHPNQTASPWNQRQSWWNSRRNWLILPWLSLCLVANSRVE